MSIRNMAAVAALAAAPLAAGCAAHVSAQHQAAASSAAASVKAHASALATSPAVLAAEKTGAAKAVSCSTPNGFTLQITGAGTPAMQAKVTHVAVTLPMHPFKSVEGWGRCVGLTKANLAKLDAFTKTTIKTNGFGKGTATKDFTAIVHEAAVLSAGSKS